MSRIAVIALAAATLAAGGACRSEKPAKREEVKPTPAAPADADVPKPLDEFAEARFEMVDRTIAARGITDERVLAAMRIVPRHELVPPDVRHQGYDDRPLPIGHESTVSQPYIIAFMTEAARVRAGDKVLEIGTGSGYQAAVLAVMGAKVYTMEIREALANRTKLVLEKLGFRDVQLRAGDGFFGWPDAAPFDAILITCATPEIPAPLLAQLKDGGRIVAPIGDDYGQELVVVTKIRGQIRRESLMDVRFGPMTGAIDKVR